MQQPKGRYVKLNIVDYLLIVALALLVLALLFRGVSMLLDRQEETCRADVEFVIRELDESAMTLLIQETEPFLLANGSTFAAGFTTSVQRETMIVWEEDGSMQEVPSTSSYKVTVSFVAEGRLAKDGTFLLQGVRRLATGEALPLTQANITYTADVVRVSVREN